MRRSCVDEGLEDLAGVPLRQQLERPVVRRQLHRNEQRKGAEHAAFDTAAQADETRAIVYSRLHDADVNVTVTFHSGGMSSTQAKPSSLAFIT